MDAGRRGFALNIKYTHSFEPLATVVYTLTSAAARSMRRYLHLLPRISAVMLQAGQTLTLEEVADPVPEPATAFLVLAAGALAAGRQLRRRRLPASRARRAFTRAERRQSRVA